MGGKLEQLLVSGRQECAACFPRLVSLVCRQIVPQTGGGGDWRSGTAAVSLKLHASPPRRTWHREQRAVGSLFCRHSTYSACRLACSLRERLWNSEGEGGMGREAGSSCYGKCAECQTHHPFVPAPGTLGLIQSPHFSPS